MWRNYAINMVSYLLLNLLFCSLLLKHLIRTGFQLIYLPPYWPELNPIEMCFLVFKSHLRWENGLVEGPSKIDHIFHTTSLVMDETLCYNEFKSCGYLVWTTIIFSISFSCLTAIAFLIFLSCFVMCSCKQAGDSSVWSQSTKSDNIKTIYSWSDS